MIVFGLEGTAWNLSAALVDEEGVLYEKSATYTPARGGSTPERLPSITPSIWPRWLGTSWATPATRG